MSPGPRALTVSCRVDGRVVARGLANVVVRRQLRVWVPVRALKRGEIVTVADLRSMRRLYERDPRRLFEGPAEHEWTVVRDLEVGQILHPTDVRRRPDISAGDEITLVSRTSGASVAVIGRARRSGCVGETILVLNPITGSIVRAVVVDKSTATLLGPQRSREGSHS
jgi:flagella basal body P-ring formation protein FlgA